MQINTYAELVAFVRNNATFNALSAPCDTPNDTELQLFAQRAIIDFVLANEQLRSIAETEHNENDITMLHEFLFDDCV